MHAATLPTDRRVVFWQIMSAAAKKIAEAARTDVNMVYMTKCPVYVYCTAATKGLGRTMGMGVPHTDSRYEMEPSPVRWLNSRRQHADLAELLCRRYIGTIWSKHKRLLFYRWYNRS